MRKIKFKKYNQPVYQPPLGTDVQYPQTRILIKKGQFDEDYIHDGVFHQWSSAYEDFGEQGAGNYVVALIETPDGLVHEALPCNVKFTEPIK